MFFFRCQSLLSRRDFLWAQAVASVVQHTSSTLHLERIAQVSQNRLVHLDVHAGDTDIILHQLRSQNGVLQQVLGVVTHLVTAIFGGGERLVVGQCDLLRCICLGFTHWGSRGRSHLSEWGSRRTLRAECWDTWDLRWALAHHRFHRCKVSVSLLLGQIHIHTGTLEFSVLFGQRLHDFFAKRGHLGLSHLGFFFGNRVGIFAGVLRRFTQRLHLGCGFLVLSLFLERVLRRLFERFCLSSFLGCGLLSRASCRYCLGVGFFGQKGFSFLLLTTAFDVATGRRNSSAKDSATNQTLPVFITGIVICKVQASLQTFEELLTCFCQALYAHRLACGHCVVTSNF